MMGVETVTFKAKGNRKELRKNSALRRSVDKWQKESNRRNAENELRWNFKNQHPSR